MKKTTILAATVAAAGAVAAAPLAAAETGAPAGPQTTELGKQADLMTGGVTQGWTVSGLKPSSDQIPYPVQGTLWEATATDQAIQGSVQPVVSNFNARAADGQTYRTLFQVATPQGVNPAAIAQGQQTSGKLYFDVTGAQPDSVVYNDGARDVLLWLKPAPAPAPSGSGSSMSYPSTGYPSTAVPQGTGAAEAPAAAGAEAAPAAPGAPAPAGAEVAPAPGSTGTPIPAGSTGTPLPEGSTGTPIPAGSAGTPAAPPAAPPAGQPAPAPAPSGAPQPVSNAEVPHYPVPPTTTAVPLP
ncbi:MPT63 family protein [Mycobacterium sp. WMMD1722]|uniref:MPT63 family protein n=1 Tax=Mycobacterium sp. WMMD1722 TaxID=3404117 RepID=UPI003BF475D7